MNDPGPENEYAQRENALRVEITSLVQLQLGVHDLTTEDRFIEDLGAESADLVNIVAGVEDSFGVVIEEGELPDLHTVNDLCRLVSRRLQEASSGSAGA